MIGKPRFYLVTIEPSNSATPIAFKNATAARQWIENARELPEGDVYVLHECIEIPPDLEPQDDPEGDDYADRAEWKARL